MADSQSKSPSSPAKPAAPKLWLAVTALILAIITLICTLVIAFVIIPNKECACSDSSSTHYAGSAMGHSTVIVNTTYMYSVENTTEYVNKSCPTNTVGIINIGQTYAPGGYFGWMLETAYRMDARDRHYQTSMRRWVIPSCLLRRQAA